MRKEKMGIFVISQKWIQDAYRIAQGKRENNSKASTGFSDRIIIWRRKNKKILDNKVMQ